MSKSIRELSLEWFFDKNEAERVELKHKHFPNTFIAFDNHWGFHFTFGQIEKMYKKEILNQKEQNGK